jgi:hypothetical protein
MINYGSALRSSTSCSRSGILSMVRLISRTLHGPGLRNSTSPSLPMITNMNPRGRRRRRKSLRASGSVSVTTITSRSANSSGRAESISICWRNRGSSGLSAKTTTGRASQIKSSISSEAASKAIDLSSFHKTGADVTSASCATATVAAKPQEIIAKIRIIELPFIPDIGGGSRKAKGNSFIAHNKSDIATITTPRQNHDHGPPSRDFVWPTADDNGLARDLVTDIHTGGHHPQRALTGLKKHALRPRRGEFERTN